MDIKESCFVAVFLAMLLAAPTFSLPMSERQTETDVSNIFIQYNRTTKII